VLLLHSDRENYVSPGETVCEQSDRAFLFFPRARPLLSRFFRSSRLPLPEKDQLSSLESPELAVFSPLGFIVGTVTLNAVGETTSLPS